MSELAISDHHRLFYKIQFITFKDMFTMSDLLQSLTPFAVIVACLIECNHNRQLFTTGIGG